MNNSDQQCQDCFKQSKTNDIPVPIWRSRGTYFVRRLNSERIAEDPRIKSVVSSSKHGIEILDSSTMNFFIKGNQLSFKNNTESSLNLEASFKNLFSTFHNFQPDIIHVTSRLFVVTPQCMNIFSKTLALKHGEKKKLVQATIEMVYSISSLAHHRFGDSVCIFDSGLTDSIQKMYNIPIDFKALGVNRFTSIPFERDEVISMESTFVICSTISSWLYKNSSNVALIISPTHSQLSTLLSCIILYSSPVHRVQDLVHIGRETLNWYHIHMKQEVGITEFMQKKIQGMDMHWSRNDHVRASASLRCIVEFAKLLHLRDSQLWDSLSTESNYPESVEGIAVLPHLKNIYFRYLRIKRSQVPMKLSQAYRPYFVIYNDKGNVIYSSMVHGIRNMDISQSDFDIPINHVISPGGFRITMYHVPSSKSGEIVIQCRSHTGILELNLADFDSSHEKKFTWEYELKDFDFVSKKSSLPNDFKLDLFYDLESEISPNDNTEGKIQYDVIDEESGDLDYNLLSEMFPSMSEVEIRGCILSSQYSSDPLTCATEMLLSRNRMCKDSSDIHRNETRQLMRQFDFSMKSREDSRVRTPFGIGQLINMSLYSITLQDSDIQGPVLFYTIQLPWGRAICNEEIIKQTELTNEILRARNDIFEAWSSSFSDGMNEVNNFSTSFINVQNEGLVHHDGIHCDPSRILNELSYDIVTRLPTYLYREIKNSSNEESKACLICRYLFQIGEEIKILPCFHSYHSGCIDSWLLLRRVCPICQRSIDT